MLGYTSKLFLSCLNHEPVLTISRDAHMSSQKT